MQRKKGRDPKKCEWVQKERGKGTWGIARREYYITEDVGWYADRKQWKKLKAFGMVHKTLREEEKPRKNIVIIYAASGKMRRNLSMRQEGIGE